MQSPYMTKSEYEKLMEFFVVRLNAMSRRFDAVEERLIRIELLLEDTGRQIQILAERIGVPQATPIVEARTTRPQAAKGFGLFGPAPDEGYPC